MKDLIGRKNRIRIVLAIGVVVAAGMCARDCYARFINERRVQSNFFVEQQTEWAFMNSKEEIAPFDLSLLLEEIPEEPVQDVPEEPAEETPEGEEPAMTEEETPEGEEPATPEEETPEGEEPAVSEGEISEDDEVTEPEKVEIVSVEAITLITAATESTPLVVRIDYPEEANRVVLSLDGSDFPQKLCYSLDGITGYQLKEAGGIELLKTEQTSAILMLDFSETEEALDVIKIHADFYQDSQKIAFTDYYENIAKYEDWNIVLQSSEPIFRETGDLKWNMIDLQADMQYDVVCELLTIEGYAETEVFTCTQSIEDNVPVIQFTNQDGEGRAPAGTYRMTVTRNYKWNEEVVIPLQKKQVTFFVNYSQL